MSKAFVVVWNQGKRTLRWDDSYIPEEPLVVEFDDDIVILGQPKVIATTRDSIHFEARRDPNDSSRVLLRFGFLDYKDGALVEILCGGEVQGFNIKGALCLQARPVHREATDYRLVARLAFRERWINQIYNVIVSFQYLTFSGSRIPFFLSYWHCVSPGPWGFLVASRSSAGCLCRFPCATCCLCRSHNGVGCLDDSEREAHSTRPTHHPSATGSHRGV